jgi:hypothetical protein
VCVCVCVCARERERQREREGERLCDNTLSLFNWNKRIKCDAWKFRGNKTVQVPL